MICGMILFITLLIAYQTSSVDGFSSSTFRGLKRAVCPHIIPYEICRTSLETTSLLMSADDVGGQVDTEEQVEIDEAVIAEELIGEIITNATEPEPVKVDPLAVAITAYERKLENEFTLADNVLRSERLKLSKLKDRESDSGKNGYYMVQAQVSEFQKRRDADQKAKVKLNKRDFVEKMLPVVDAFRAAPVIATASTEKEENMHLSFKTLLTSIEVVFDKYGFKEYQPEVGDKFEVSKHAVVEARDDQSATSTTIIDTTRLGMYDTDGDVLRKAQVIVSLKGANNGSEVVSPSPATPKVEPEAEAAEVTEKAEGVEEEEKA
jgi:molecular chaperone GrpE (heat shock protein)